MKHTYRISNERRPRIGIGSYAYRYNIGFQGFTPAQPMELFAFIQEARRLGVDGVQLCENLEYETMRPDDRKRLRDLSEEAGLFVELGMRDLTVENLAHHIDLAESVNARFIRAVAGAPSAFPEEDQKKLVAQVLGVFDELLPVLEEKGLVVGLENHYDLPTEALISIVQSVNSDHLGLVFDTTNALGFVEQPEETLSKMLPYVRSVHIKDYVVEKVEAGYLIRGTSLGEGLLDCPKLLDQILERRPDASLIIEMTIRRNAEMSPEEIVAWERSKVEESVTALGEYAARVVAG